VSGSANYTWYDIYGCLKALLAFPLFLLAPGYVIGWLSNVLQFRRRSVMEKAAIGLVLSVAVSGILATVVARYLSLMSSLRLFEALGIAFLVCVAWEFRRTARAALRLRGVSAALVVILGLWAIVVVASLVDLQIGHRLYLSATAYDHCIRAAFTRAVVRSGVPPANPFFFPGARVPMRYYYYWNVIAALPSLWTGVDPRLAMFASCAWCGWAVVAILALYLKYVLGDAVDLRWKSLLGAGLLAVTGLDIIPTAILAAIPPHTIHADMEWWRMDTVTSWIDSLLWVPHHVAGLVACLAGFLLLWDAAPKKSGRVMALVLAGAAFASGGGYSIYVAFTFGVFLAAWFMLTLHERRWNECLMTMAAGILTIIFSIPYLHDLRGPGAGMGFAQLTIRDFEVFEPLLFALGIHARWVSTLSGRLLLPVDFAIELGFFFAVGLIQWRKDRVGRWAQLSLEKKALWLMLGTSLAVTTFLRSRTINTNDLSLRSVLLMQFVLLLWAVPLIYDLLKAPDSKVHRRALAALIRPSILAVLLGLGVIGTVYQVVMLRFYNVLADTGRLPDVPTWMPEPGKIGETTYQLRQAYEGLEAVLPLATIVQKNPLSPISIFHLLYSDYQSVAGIPVCGTAFGGDPFKCIGLQLPIYRLFNTRTGADASNLDQLCDSLRINVLLVTDVDPAWKRRDTWVWDRNPMFSNDSVRAFQCGSKSTEIVRLQHHNQ